MKISLSFRTLLLILAVSSHGSLRLLAQDGQAAEEPPLNLESLRIQFEVESAELKRPLQVLNTRYEENLAALEKTFVKNDNTEGLTALKTHLEIYQTSGWKPHESLSELSHLQRIYLKESDRLRLAGAPRERALTTRYLGMLKDLETKLSEAGQNDQASAAKSERLILETRLEELEVLEAKALAKEPDWAYVELAVVGHEYTETQVAGTTSGGYKATDVSNPPGILVGFEFIIQKFKSGKPARGYRPIYRSREGRTMGQYQAQKEGIETVEVVAREGYAVGGLQTQADDMAIRRFRVAFMKILPNGLDVRDSYESDWVGEFEDAKKSSQIDSEGKFVVGLVAKSGLGPDALQLLRLKE